MGLYHDFSLETSNYQSNEHLKAKLFPSVLHDFVSDPETDHIITWLPHGRSFMILSRDDDEIKSDYFRFTQVTSLIRQLNGWGFHRVGKGVDKASYFHEVRT